MPTSANPVLIRDACSLNRCNFPIMGNPDLSSLATFNNHASPSFVAGQSSPVWPIAFLHENKELPILPVYQVWVAPYPFAG